MGKSSMYRPSPRTTTGRPSSFSLLGLCSLGAKVHSLSRACSASRRELVRVTVRVRVRVKVRVRVRPRAATARGEHRARAAAPGEG